MQGASDDDVQDVVAAQRQFFALVYCFNYRSDDLGNRVVLQLIREGWRDSGSLLDRIAIQICEEQVWDKRYVKDVIFIVGR